MYFSLVIQQLNHKKNNCTHISYYCLIVINYHFVDLYSYHHKQV